MDTMFTMIMMVEMSNADTKKVNDELGKIAEEMDLSIHLQNEKVFRSMHRI